MVSILSLSSECATILEEGAALRDEEEILQICTENTWVLLSHATQLLEIDLRNSMVGMRWTLSASRLQRQLKGKLF